MTHVCVAGRYWTSLKGNANITLQIVFPSECAIGNELPIRNKMYAGLCGSGGSCVQSTKCPLLMFLQLTVDRAED